jgi:organic radical activating enzyme
VAQENMTYCEYKWNEFHWVLNNNNISSCCESPLHALPATGSPWNSPENISDRAAMLSGVRPSSCDYCWRREDAGIESRRDRLKQHKSFTDTHVQMPERLVLNLHNFCNLQCVYCCKEYSSSWYKDIKRNGNYNQDARYQIFPIDNVRFKTSVSQISKTANYQRLLSIMQSSDFHMVKSVHVTGGEPLLNMDLLTDLLQQIRICNPQAQININTGLGVPLKNLQKLSTAFAGQINLYVSCENTHGLAEFNRSNLVWSRFQQNLDHVRQHFDISMRSVLSITTIWGFAEFLDMIAQHENSVPIISFLTEPDFMDLTRFHSDLYKAEIDEILARPNLTAQQISSFQELKKIQVQNDSRLSGFLGEFARRNRKQLPWQIDKLIKNIECSNNM